MEFGSLTPTVDIFELVLAVVLVALAFPAALYNVREAWGEKEWAIDDPDPAMRRLGINRYDNARLLLLAVCFIALGDLSALLVPSALQLATPATVDFQDLLNAVLQRIVYIGVVLCITYKAVNDAVWRRDVDRRRKARAAAGVAAAAGAVPVVEAPAVVIPAEGKD